MSGRATVGERPDLLPGVGGPGAPGGPGGPGGPAGPARGRKGPRSKKARRRNIILAVIAVFIMLSGGAVVAGGYYFDSVQLPADVPLPESTLITYADGNTPMAKLGDKNRTIIDRSKIPDMVKKAVVAAEDNTFYTNHGVDAKGVIRAAWNNVTGGSRQGASTITQQYVRTAFDLKGVSYARKVREAVMAMKIDQTYSKDEILGFYLNTVYFGEGAYGIEAAAGAYFNKNADKLTTEEGMVLAGAIKQPEGKDGYNPNENLNNSKDRWGNYIKPNMVKLGYVTQEQADKMVYPTNIRKPDANTTSASQYGKDTPTGFVVHHVMDELLYHTGGKFTEQDLKTGGYKIVTTIDKTMEDAAISIVDKTKQGSLLANQPPRLAPALVAIDPKSGRVMAYYGGHDGGGYDEAGIYRDPILEKNDKGEPDYDWRGLHHSPGSTFKMYTLATALSQGYSIDSYWLGPSSRRFNGRGLEPDPAHPGQYRETNKTPPVTNSDGDACPKQDNNYCSLQQALKLSTNTVYYGVGVKVGPDKVIDMAHAMGIQHIWDGNDKRWDLADKGDGQNTFSGNQVYPQHISPEVAIGQYGITVMDNAAGVATIANGGVHFETHFVKSVSRGGQAVYNEVTKMANLAQSMHLSRDQVADEQWAMSTVIENSGGVNKLNGRPAGSKTGTWEVCATTTGCEKKYINQTRDAWYAGFTPDLATVVHISSSDINNSAVNYYSPGSKKEQIMFGINTPGQVWKKFMDTVLKGKPASKLLQAKHVAGTQDGEGQSPEPQQPSSPPDGGGNQGPGGGQPCIPPQCQPTVPGQISPSRRPGA